MKLVWWECWGACTGCVVHGLSFWVHCIYTVWWLCNRWALCSEWKGWMWPVALSQAHMPSMHVWRCRPSVHHGSFISGGDKPVRLLFSVSASKKFASSPRLRELADPLSLLQQHYKWPECQALVPVGWCASSSFTFTHILQQSWIQLPNACLINTN